MKKLKYLSFTTSLILICSPLLLVDAAIKELKSETQITNNEISFSDAQSIKCHSKHCRPRRSNSHELFLYASTPLDYVGQAVGTAPVVSGTRIAVNFPVIGDTSTIPPVSENDPGIFTVLKSGHYLINWSLLVKNFDGGGFNTSFEIALTKNGTSQPPNLFFNIPPNFGMQHNPSCESLSGSIILPLEIDDIIQLDITSISSSDLPTPLVVGAASINFIRISKV